METRQLRKRISGEDVIEAVFAEDSDDGLIDDDHDVDWEPMWNADIQQFPVENSRTDSEHSDGKHGEDASLQTPTMSVLSDASNSTTECNVSTSAILMTPRKLKRIPKDTPSTSTPFIQRQISKKIKPSANNIIWNAEKDNAFSNTVPIFTGIHQVNLKLEKSEPIDVFSQFFTAELLDYIVYQSNLYAMQQDISSPLNLTRGELMIFLGINIIMTYIRYPRVRMYWSQDPGLRCSMVADSMSVNRFEKIRRNLHFADNDSHETQCTDKLWKIRPVLVSLQQSFQAAVDPEECQSVDEMMIPFTGQSSLKQYIRSKPKPWGYKVWVRSGVSGYVYDFEFYQGANGERPAAELGLCADVVMRLCDGLAGKGHKVYFDNLFTTIELMKALRTQQIYAVGTLRKNRMMGASESLPNDKNMKTRGSMAVATSDCNITVVKWNDNNFVHTASTYAGIHPVGSVQRWDKSAKEKVEVARPNAIEIYNKHMGGVDLTDFLISCYRHTLKHKRWYLRIFFHFLNIGITNSWIICKWLDPSTKIDLLGFRSRVAASLMQAGKHMMTRKGRGRPISIPDQTSTKLTKTDRSTILDFSLGHWPTKVIQKNASRCKNQSCKRKTRYMCSICKQYLCPECFEEYHK